MKNAFVVVRGDGKLQAITRTERQAYQAAERAGALQVSTDEQLDGLHDFFPNARRKVTPKLSHELMGKLRVNWKKVNDFGWDFGQVVIDGKKRTVSMGAHKAFQRLKPYFPGKKFEQGSVKRVAAQSSGEGLVMNLLGQNYKTAKTGKDALGGLSVNVQGLSLLPHSLWGKAIGQENGIHAVGGGLVDVCAGASAGCRAGCLVYSGQNAVDMYNVVLKLAKTNALMAEPEAFVRILAESCVRHFETEPGCTVNLVRLNVLSDVPWELVCPELLEFGTEAWWNYRTPAMERQAVGLTSPFYDYTKVPGRKMMDHYDLTFSYSGENMSETLRELNRGRRVAMVFIDHDKGDRKPSGLPATVKLGGKYWPVVDGDTHDARPFDAGGVVVGLLYKAPKTAGTKVRESVEDTKEGRRYRKGFEEAYGAPIPSGRLKGVGTLMRGLDRAKAAAHSPTLKGKTKKESEEHLREWERRTSFVVPVQESDDGALMTPVIPRAMNGAIRQEQSDLLSQRQVGDTFGAPAILDEVDLQKGIG